MSPFYRPLKEITHFGGTKIEIGLSFHFEIKYFTTRLHQHIHNFYTLCIYHLVIDKEGIVPISKSLNPYHLSLTQTDIDDYKAPKDVSLKAKPT